MAKALNRCKVSVFEKLRRGHELVQQVREGEAEAKVGEYLVILHHGRLEIHSRSLFSLSSSTARLL